MTETTLVKGAHKLRNMVTRLGALRRTWIPMWSMREDWNGRACRAAIRLATEAHLSMAACHRRPLAGPALR